MNFDLDNLDWLTDGRIVLNVILSGLLTALLVSGPILFMDQPWKTKGLTLFGTFASFVVGRMKRSPQSIMKEQQYASGELPNRRGTQP